LSGLRGDDLLDGGAGDDVLVGGQGMDRLTGSAGADRFVFAPGETGRNATTADRVLDFTSADGDRIDLTGYDADMSTAGDDAFRFIGTRAFSGGAGELRVRALGGELFVQGDTNGDGTADFMINMGAVPMMAATDFLL
jgi:Ca2+-binding RTX toxin-like protein